MERLTWREKQSGKAWQRLVRDRVAKNDKGSAWWKGVSLNLGHSVIRPTTRAIAEKIILEYEWLGTLPFGASRFYGIFFEWACGGVVCFADAYINIHAHRTFGVAKNEVTTLIRGACAHWTPTGSASRLISKALMFERRAGKKVALAYADSEAGEYGTVYQACNWKCLAIIKATGHTELIAPDGRIYNSRVTEKIRRMAGRLGSMNNPDVVDWLKAKGWRQQQPNPKRRYIYILATGKEREHIERRIAPLVAEYPKRAPESGAVATSGGKAVQARPARSRAKS